MEITRLILLGLYVVAVVYMLYRLFLRKDPSVKEYEKLYNEIVSSEKYKVKGQFDK